MNIFKKKAEMENLETPNGRKESSNIPISVNIEEKIYINFCYLDLLLLFCIHVFGFVQQLSK